MDEMKRLEDELRALPPIEEDLIKAEEYKAASKRLMVEVEKEALRESPSMADLELEDKLLEYGSVLAEVEEGILENGVPGMSYGRIVPKKDNWYRALEEVVLDPMGKELDELNSSMRIRYDGDPLQVLVDLAGTAGCITALGGVGYLVCSPFSGLYGATLGILAGLSYVLLTWPKTPLEELYNSITEKKMEKIAKCGNKLSAKVEDIKSAIHSKNDEEIVKRCMDYGVRIDYDSVIEKLGSYDAEVIGRFEERLTDAETRAACLESLPLVTPPEYFLNGGSMEELKGVYEELYKGDLFQPHTEVEKHISRVERCLKYLGTAKVAEEKDKHRLYLAEKREAARLDAKCFVEEIREDYKSVTREIGDEL